jgi:hypothetical protein
VPKTDRQTLRVVSGVRMTGMTMVVVATVPGGEHRACKHQQESYDKNLLHGKHPSTLRFPADRCCCTNVPKEKRVKLRREPGELSRACGPLAAIETDEGGVHWGYDDEAGNFPKFEPSALLF